MWVPFILAYVLVAVQSDTISWWNTSIGQRMADILGFVIAVAAIAGAWKGIKYLGKEVFGIKIWFTGRRIAADKRDALLDDMLSDHGWPTLTQDVENVKKQLEDVHSLVNSRMEDALNRIDQLEQLLRDSHVIDTTKSGPNLST